MRTSSHLLCDQRPSWKQSPLSPFMKMLNEIGPWFRPASDGAVTTRLTP
ncbi:hypothetical protein [Lysobacter gummosus]